MSDERLKHIVELGAAIKAADVEARRLAEQARVAKKRFKTLKAELQGILDGDEIASGADGQMMSVARDDGSGSRTTKELVLEFLRARVGQDVTTEQVVNGVDAKADTIRTTLNRLSRTDEVENPSRGLYRFSGPAGGGT